MVVLAILANVPVCSGSIGVTVGTGGDPARVAIVPRRSIRLMNRYVAFLHEGRDGAHWVLR